jgi:hypothetical protein
MDVYYRENENEPEQLIASGTAPKYTGSEYTYFGLHGDIGVRWDDFCVRDIGFAEVAEPVTGLLVAHDDEHILTHDNETIGIVQ